MVLSAYWRVGLYRWFLTFHRSLVDVRDRPALRPDSIAFAGGRDPLVDRDFIISLFATHNLELPGAHAAMFSDPEAMAERVVNALV